MKRKALFTPVFLVLLCLLVATAAMARQDTKDELGTTSQVGGISDFNLENPADVRFIEPARTVDRPQGRRSSGDRVPVGSAMSPDVGPGIGTSIGLSFHDDQWVFMGGRHVMHSINGSDVDVHFTYESTLDSTTGEITHLSGYQVYNANTGENHWPLNFDGGCELQSADSVAYGLHSNVDITPSGLAVLGAHDRFFQDTTQRTVAGDTTVNFWRDHTVYYQSARHDCEYVKYGAPATVNVSWVDSSLYHPLMEGPTLLSAAYVPEILLDEVGGQMVTHLTMMDPGAGWIPPDGPAYVNGVPLFFIMYFRKIGSDHTGTWTHGTQIDSIYWYHRDMQQDPNSDKVAIIYANHSWWGRQLNGVGQYDVDLYYRESLDGGLVWQPKFDASRFQNVLPLDPRHQKAGEQVKGLYTSDGNFHLLWGAEPTSLDPYADGYNWRNFGANLYHWDLASWETDSMTAVVKVANGVWTDPETFLGNGINTKGCSYTPVNTSWVGWGQLSECNGHLYAVWAAYHSRANELTYAEIQALTDGGGDPPLDDCGYVGDRLESNKTNAELFMSVSTTAAGKLWDSPRNLTNSYTPNCSHSDDVGGPGPVCGNEGKPSVEPYGWDESGLSVEWPTPSNAVVATGGTAGTWWLDAMYFEDRYPGEWWRGNSDMATLNSMKWVRLACVEHVPAAVISSAPQTLTWPRWVEAGNSRDFEITVINSGNVTLTVGSPTLTPASSWLSTSIDGVGMSVSAGATNTGTFDITIDAAGVPAGTPTWMDGTVDLPSNSVTDNPLTISIHVLAADTVVDPIWDTVGTDVLFDGGAAAAMSPTDGERIGLSVGNTGEFGYYGIGGVNLDYSESGEECGTRIPGRDSYYIVSGTPFTLMADGSGSIAPPPVVPPSSVSLTQSFGDLDQLDDNGWDPAETPGFLDGQVPVGGLSADGSYDSVFVGKAVNRDTTIAWEKTYFAPRVPVADPLNDVAEYIVVKSKIYSANGQTHNHVTLGHAIDWDVPSDSGSINKPGVSSAGNFTYIQGTDSTGHEDPLCLNSTRFATEAIVKMWTNDVCTWHEDVYGSVAMSFDLMDDTALARDGSPLDPAQPDGYAWWEDIATHPGNGWDQDLPDGADLATWMTFLYDATINATDTIYVWTVLSTVRDGAVTNLEANVTAGRNWAMSHIDRSSCSCCEGRTGDANKLDGDTPTVSDIGDIINQLFGDGTVVNCLDEADADTSAYTHPPVIPGDITVSDIGWIINELFGDGTMLPDCP